MSQVHIGDIAVIGMSGRFPGADSVDALWELLRARRCAIDGVPPSRWDMKPLFDPTGASAHKSYSDQAGFVQDIDLFDARFFRMTPRQALFLDPQQRVFLEEAWKAIEDAGYSDRDLDGARCGVFVGCKGADYQMRLLGLDGEALAEIDRHLLGGNDISMLPARISYLLNLRGPSIPINTACSSGLVAIHLACESINSGVSDMALAGGVEFMTTPGLFLSLAASGVLARSGRCRPFEERADGMVLGEGAAVVVLKPVARALADGDVIHGVIRASALNQDGRSNGINAPNGEAQTELECDVYEACGINPDTLGYVEAHGTGTVLGDPIEIHALTDAFARFTPRKRFCPIGSVKANLGHPLSAAGVAGLIKILLAMRHGEIPAPPDFIETNSRIELENSPFFVNTEPLRWDRPAGHPRRAALSSFGFSGTNAHALIEESPERIPGGNGHGDALLLLSAKTEPALARRAADLAEWLEQNGDADLASVAYTLHRGRTHFPIRAALVVRDAGEARAALRAGVVPRAAGAAAESHRALLERVTVQLKHGALPPAAHRGALLVLAESYHAGLLPEWQAVYGIKPPLRVSLPTYPFERESYWVDAPSEVMVWPKPRVPVSVSASSTLFLRPEWQRDDGAAGAGGDGDVLLFDEGIDRRGQFEHRGVRAIVVEPAACFERIERDRFTVDPTSAEDFSKLLAALESDGALPRRAVLLWTRRPIVPLAMWTRAWLSRANAPQCDVLAASVLRDGALAPEQSALAAFFRTVTREAPRISGRVAGFASAPDAAMLLDELGRESGTEVLRDGARREVSRWIETSTPSPAAQTLRSGAVCVISGGAGGIGAHVARFLASEYAARVVLVGRSERNEAIDALLRSLGDAIYVSADVGSEHGAYSAIAAARERFAAVNAVFHVAGVHRDAYVARKTAAQIEEVCTPKIDGARFLDAATRHDALDAFVLFSSISSIAANAGQSDYAYANHFLNAFAAERERAVRAGARRGRTLAIAWPLWKDGGMRMSDADVAMLRTHLGLEPMPTEAALDALRKLLASGLTTAGVVYGDVAKMRGFLSAAPGPAAPAADDGAPLEETEALVARILSSVTRIPVAEILPETPFEDYGIDSVVIKSFNTSLEREVGSLPATLLFEARNLRELSRAISAAAPNPPARVRDRMPEKELPPRAAAETAGSRDIAIIGVAGRYPDAADLESLWRNLRDARDAVREIARDGWDLPSIFDPDPARARTGKTYSKWGAFLEEVDAFDAAFFRISPREAELMDPQERLFLETAWHALEDAGHPPARLKHRFGSRAPVGVFIGVSPSAYPLLGPEEWRKGNRVYPTSAPWSMANRVSYLFDLGGPSLPVDTACSSSLVAVHLAVESIRRGECSMALAGGVNLYLHPSKYIAMSQVHMLSPRGKCHAFAADADGFVPGEGVGAIVLRPLADALRDGDRIHAVIKGSAVNHGGKTNSYSVPSPQAQAELVRRALGDARVSADTLQFIEAHGTGTELGDPIEIRGLTLAFREETERTEFCSIASLKSNIGHLEAAAGIAGLTRILLQLRHDAIAPTLHASRLNPNIDFAASPFRVQREPAAWPRVAAPRRAGISSFGAGGANAHVIVEEAPAPRPMRSMAGPFLVPISAKTPSALRAAVAALLEHLDRGGPHDLASIAYTLQVGREPMPERFAARCATLDELRAALTRFLAGEVPSPDAGLAPHDWREAPPLVSLPLYPFERKRFWIESAPAEISPAAKLHPLIESNVSTLAEQKFRVAIDAGEFVVRDHLVEGERVLPGVAYVEMVRAAGELAGERAVKTIRRLVWVNRLAARGNAATAEVRLSPANGGAVAFSVVSRDRTRDVVHAQGELTFDDERPAPARLDIDAIAARCPRVIDHDECYLAGGLTPADVPVHLGPGLRSIRTLRLGRDEALVDLAVPESIRHTTSAYALHPSLLDGALQAAIGLREAGRHFFPFAIERIDVHAPLPPSCRAYLRVTERSVDDNGGFERVDVTFASDEGTVLLHFEGYTSREAPRALVSTKLYRREWMTIDPLPPAARPPRAVSVIGDAALADAWRKLHPECAVGGSGAPELVVFVDPQSLLDVYAVARPMKTGAIMLVHRHRPDDPLSDAFAAFARSAELENGGVHFQSLAVPPAIAGVDLVALIESEREAPLPEVSYARGTRSVPRLMAQEAAAEAVTFPRGGVVLIAGGTGTVGIAFAEHFFERHQARIALLARNEPAAAALERIVALRDAGAEVEVLPAALEDRDAVVNAVAAIRRRFGAIDAVFHAAGAFGEGHLADRSDDDVRRVLAAKLPGLVHLDEATRGDALHFFAVCSSTAASLGNPGQTDYAFANAFASAYVRARRGAGRSLAVEYPLWQEGHGERVARSLVEWLERSVGIKRIPSAIATEAFDRALATGQPHAVVLHGDAARFEEALCGAPAARVQAASPGAPTGAVTALLRRDLTGFAAELLGLPATDIKPDMAFDAIGFESVSLIEFANSINRALAIDLMPTLFFERTTIAGVADAIAERYAGAVMRRYGTGAVAESAAPPAAPPAAQPAILRTKSRLERTHAERDEDGDAIAIVGMSGAMPQSDDVDELWRNVIENRNLIGEVPPDRWRWNDHGAATRYGGFMKSVDRFDPSYFGISPREAALMDPQHRLFIEHTWRAIEDAGHKPSDLSGTRTAVFAGISVSDYGELVRLRVTDFESHAALGLSSCMLPNRISYLLNVRGPSEPIDTGCSSAAIAIHRAVESIRRDGCELAIAGGVSVMLNPMLNTFFSKSGVLSAGPHCRAFDAGASGTVRGEGVGVVLLKPLRAALRDGNPVHALIRGSAENHGGRSSSPTAPNAGAQAEVVAAAWQKAGFDPATIDYVEAHGTGTALGDPVEVEGLKEALRRAGGTAANARIGIGSVKTNVGHLLPAAAMPALFKVVRAMREGVIPANLHFERLNRFIDLTGSPLYVVGSNTPWPAPAPEGVRRPRRAGISSFGMGGSNAHLAIEEFVDERVASHGPGPHLLLLSAQDDERLREYAGKMTAWLRATPDAGLAALAFTLQVGRESMAERLAVIASDAAQAIEAWERFAGGTPDARTTLRGGSSDRGGLVTTILDEEMSRSLAEAALAARDLRKLASLWILGAQPDWSRLHSQQQRRISLPTYPFARVRCWIDETETAGRAEAIVRTTPSSPEPLFYEPHWSEAAADPAERGRTQLLFGDDGGLGFDAIRVRFGDSFRRLSPDEFSIPREDASAYARLLGELRGEERLPDEILWLEGAGDAIEPLFHLANAYASLEARRSLRRIVCAARIDADPWEEAIAGYAAALPILFPNARFSLVTSDAVLSAAQLHDELADRHAAAEVQYSAGTRRVKTFARVTVTGDARNVIREGAYVISGGMGGIGRLLAEHLITRYRARVLLLGRNPLDGERAEVLNRLQTLGGDVLYLPADVSDRGSLEAALASARNRLGLFHGVFHAAGTANKQPLTAKPLAVFRETLRTKARGAELLDELTADDPLDFFALFSSTSVMLGDMGQGDYAIGNRFLDAFAHARERRRANGQRNGASVSINWPLWREGGIHLESGTEASTLRFTGMEYLERNDALRILESLLAAPRPQVAVIVTREPARVEAYLNRAAAVVTPQPSGNVRQRLLDDVRRIASSLIGIPAGELDPDADVVSFGVDSIMLANFVSRLNDTFPFLDVNQSALIGAATFGGIIDTLLEGHAEAFARHYGAAPAAKSTARTPHGVLSPEIIPLQPHGTATPSFWVPGSYGFSQSFRALPAVLGPDVPIYAFHARGNDGKRMPFSRLEAMAAHYVECIRRARPSGPYTIGGYSFGGLVALEIAHQLVRAGDEVAGLVLIDTYPPTEWIYDMTQNIDELESMKLVLANFLTGRGEWSDTITAADLASTPERMRDARLVELIVERGKNTMPADELFGIFKGAQEVNHYASEAYRLYKPAPYGGSSVLYVKSKQGVDEYIASYDYLAVWRTLVAGQLCVVEVPHRHSRLMQQPALDSFAAELRSYVTSVGAPALVAGGVEES